MKPDTDLFEISPCKKSEIDLFETLKSETVAIMQYLKIEIRPNISKDGELILLATDTLIGYNSKFYTDRGSKGVFYSESPDSMYYLDSYILTSESFKQIVQNKVKSSAYEKIKAYSVVVHELTHYYQKGEFAYLNGNKYIKYNGNNDKEYVSQLAELDAHAVQAFYFLKNINQIGLVNNIFKTNSQNIQAIKEKLIDEYRHINAQPVLYK